MTFSLLMGFWLWGALSFAIGWTTAILLVRQADHPEPPRHDG